MDYYDSDLENDDGMPVDAKTEDQLIKKTASSIKVDVFELANEEERKDPSVHFKESIHVTKPKEEETSMKTNE